MPQINLLKQKTSSQVFLDYFPPLMVKILAVAVLVLVGVYVWKYVQARDLAKQIVEEQQAVSDTTQKAGSVPNRNEIYTRQAQLAAYNQLLGKHVYWSAVLPALAKSTLKGASYSSISMTNEGTLTLTVTVPSLDSIDQYLQVFDQPEIYQNFYNLRIGAFRKIETAGGESYQFDAQLDFNPALLEYQSQNK